VSVFVDTSALYAVLDRDDANHEMAAAEWRRLLESGVSMLVSNYILVETTALVQHRLGMAAVRALTDSMEPVLDVEWVTREDHDGARAALLAANRRRLSLVDCTSFVIMRRLGVFRAFAFDQHFAEQGLGLQP
jgi:predicted nucleic acid-binding protein